MESFDISLHIYSQLLFDKEVKNTKWEISLISKWYWEKLDNHIKKNKADLLAYTTLKIDSKWITT